MPTPWDNLTSLQNPGNFNFQNIFQQMAQTEQSFLPGQSLPKGPAGAASATASKPASVPGMATANTLGVLAKVGSALGVAANNPAVAGLGNVATQLTQGTLANKYEGALEQYGNVEAPSALDADRSMQIKRAVQEQKQIANMEKQQRFRNVLDLMSMQQDAYKMYQNGLISQRDYELMKERINIENDRYEEMVRSNKANEEIRMKDVEAQRIHNQRMLEQYRNSSNTSSFGGVDPKLAVNLVLSSTNLPPELTENFEVSAITGADEFYNYIQTISGTHPELANELAHRYASLTMGSAYGTFAPFIQFGAGPVPPRGSEGPASSIPPPKTEGEREEVSRADQLKRLDKAASDKKWNNQPPLIFDYGSKAAEAIYNAGEGFLGSLRGSPNDKYKAVSGYDPYNFIDRSKPKKVPTTIEDLISLPKGF